MHRSLAVAAVLVAALLACGDDDSEDTATGTVPAVSPTTGGDETVPTSAPVSSDESADTAATAPPPSFVATPITGGTVVAGPSQPGFPLDPDLPLVRAAVDDLAARLDIAPTDVTVVDARAVTWGDSSLGCPEPGMNYVQRLVDGTLVVLEATGREYEYHGGDPLFLCADPRPPSGG